MPETKLERVIATIALVAIVGLTALVVVGLLDYRQQASASPGGQRASTDGTGASTVGERHQRDRAGARLSASGTPRALLAASTLVVTATRGDCWLEVHAVSADGDILYEGILAKGDARTLTGNALWIRLGAAENLDVTLNGRRVDNLPEGTADVLVTSRGLQPSIS